MNDNNKYLAEVRARCEAATPGPWEWAGDGLIGTDPRFSAKPSVCENVLCACDEDSGGAYSGSVAVLDMDNETNDRPFIAHARQDIPRLLAMLEDAHARIQDYQDDARAVLAEECAGDEVHCTCVPHRRREVARLKAFGEAVVPMLERRADADGWGRPNEESKALAIWNEEVHP